MQVTSKSIEVSCQEVVLRVIRAAKEWQDVALIKKKPDEKPTLQSPFITARTKARQPSPNLIHCYSDAAWCLTSSACVFGWIFKSATGTKIKDGTGERQIAPSALAAEAMSLKEALKEALASGFKDIVCYSDCNCLISLLTGSSSETSIKGIIHDISVLSKSLTNLSFTSFLV